jgi:glycosyltransferase involved in cell wall biosynthesis
LISQRILKREVVGYNPDIIHVHHPFLLGRAVLKIARNISIPIIFTHHTQYHRYAHYMGIFSPIAGYLVRKIVKKFCNRVDCIIVQSVGVQKMLQVDGVTQQIVLLASGLQKCFISSEKAEVRSKVQTPIQLLYVGRLVPEKNVPFLFDVVKELSIPFVLTIVGYGSDTECLKSLAYEKYNFSKKEVVFIPKRTPEELIFFYRNADLFLFPSSSDTQGLVLAEAMSQGCPVLAVPGMGQEDIIKQGQNGLIVSNTQTMAQKIELIASDDLLFQKLQKGALCSAQKYSPEYIGKQLEQLYHSCKK